MKKFSKLVMDSKRLSRHKSERFEHVHKELNLEVKKYERLKEMNKAKETQKTQTNPDEPKKPTGFFSKGNKLDVQNTRRLGILQRMILNRMKVGYKIRQFMDTQNMRMESELMRGEDVLLNLKQADVTRLLERKLIKIKTSIKRTEHVTIIIYTLA